MAAMSVVPRLVAARRYDGLVAFRINPSGASVLGLAAYVPPEADSTERAITGLPNHDIVALGDLPPHATRQRCPRSPTRQVTGCGG